MSVIIRTFGHNWRTASHHLFSLMPVYLLLNVYIIYLKIQALKAATKIYESPYNNNGRIVVRDAAIFAFLSDRPLR